MQSSTLNKITYAVDIPTKLYLVETRKRSVDRTILFDNKAAIFQNFSLISKAKILKKGLRDHRMIMRFAVNHAAWFMSYRMLRYKVTKPNGFTKHSTQKIGYSTWLMKAKQPGLIKSKTMISQNYWEYLRLTIDPHQYSCIWVLSVLLKDYQTQLSDLFNLILIRLYIKGTLTSEFWI